MLGNLIFSLRATMPIFLMMVLGYYLKKIKWLDEQTTKTLNNLVFRVFLPALLFMDLAKQDFGAIWDTSFVLFCLVATLLSIVISAGLSLLCKDRTDRGEFIQASYRSAAATLGIAFMTNIYDNAAMVALMIIGSVPIYNTVAVLVLSLTSPESTAEKNTVVLMKKTLKNIATNPIILGILVGLIWSVAKLPQPPIMEKSITYLGNIASPMALIALGASFEFSDVRKKLDAILLVNFSKLFLYCMLFLPVAIWLGYRDEKLVAALIMLGSATTSSSFIMAKNMGHKGTLSSCAVMTTTLLSSFSLTLWLFVLKSLGYI
ncbi:MAG: AEC family transporter [bacterium]|nr:AEC family transporter [bacterium]